MSNYYKKGKLETESRKIRIEDTGGLVIIEQGAYEINITNNQVDELFQMLAEYILYRDGEWPMINKEGK